MTGNPMFPDDRRAEAIAGATHVLVTHGHGDHTGDAVALRPRPPGARGGVLRPLFCSGKRGGGWGYSFYKRGPAVRLRGPPVTIGHRRPTPSPPRPRGGDAGGPEAGY